MSVTAPAATGRPPLWLVLATAAMAIVLLAMSVTETSFKGQYLIDQGEYLSLLGLVFITIAGLHLHRHGRLAASLPLVFPWLLYPVITQGDQIIDNLSITWMRIIVHVLLAAIFAMPVAIVVYAAKWFWGLSRGATRNLTVALLAAEFWLAYQFLGWLMIATLIVMIAIVVIAGSRAAPGGAAGGSKNSAALAFLFAGVAASAGLYLGFKNRPGAYQGSPSHYMDPTQQSGFQASTTTVPTGIVELPANPEDVQLALSAYANALQRVLDGYYLLDRNYNYHFHNELFIRDTPLVPDYRAQGLKLIDVARPQRAAGDAAFDRVQLSENNPLKALLADVRAYVAFTFERAATLERMSGDFETTKAGLQHATHIYEGEGKYLGVQLADLLRKHHATLENPEVAPLVSDFVAKCRAIHDRYSNRIVGF